MIDLNLFFFTQQSGWQIISPQVHFTGYKAARLTFAFCNVALLLWSNPFNSQPFSRAHPHALCSSEHGRRITGKFQCEQTETKRLRGRLFETETEELNQLEMGEKNNDRRFAVISLLSIIRSEAASYIALRRWERDKAGSFFFFFYTSPVLFHK